MMAKTTGHDDREAETSSAATPLDRRLFILRSLAGTAAVAALGTAGIVATAAPAEAQVYRRVTDADPWDRAGRVVRVRPRRRVTDSDPVDAVGRGRGTVRVVRRRRRVTDNDPHDPQGRGRGWR
jgi:hypothetical protein